MYLYKIKKPNLRAGVFKKQILFYFFTDFTIAKADLTSFSNFT